MQYSFLGWKSRDITDVVCPVVHLLKLRLTLQRLEARYKYFTNTVPEQQIKNYDRFLEGILLLSNAKITPLFEKQLSASDVVRIGRLVLPKRCAELQAGDTVTFRDWSLKESLSWDSEKYHLLLLDKAPLTNATAPAPAPAATQAPAPTLPQAAQPAVVPLVGPNANPLDLFPQGLPDMGANAPEPARNDSVYESNVIPTTLLLTSGQNLVEPDVSGSTQPPLNNINRNTKDVEPTCQILKVFFLMLSPFGFTITTTTRNAGQSCTQSELEEILASQMPNI
ncbi:ubiquitin receptor RAD23d-like protein [Tanacetum coccineum]